MLLSSTEGQARLAVSAVEGRFQSNAAGTCTFSPGISGPMFTQVFESLNFNPPLGLIPGTNISPSTQILTNIITNPDGSFLRAIPADGSGLTAGVGVLTKFFSTLTGTFLIDGSQQVILNIYHDDGFVFGVGGDVLRVSGPLVGTPLSGQTALRGLPVVGAYNRASIPRKSTVVLQFASAGEYPFELDYFQCLGTTKTLTVFADQEPIPSTLKTATPGSPGAPTNTPTPTRSGGISPVMTGSPTVLPTPTGQTTPSTPGTITPSPGTGTATPTPSRTRTRTVTASPPPSPTPTPTMVLGVGLVGGEATGNPGDSVVMTFDFIPSASDGRPFGPDEIAVLDVVLDFPRLDFDATDADRDGVPDAIVFNPNDDPRLRPFVLTVFNPGTATENRMLDVEVIARDEGNDILPAATVMAISFKIPERSPGGNLLVTPVLLLASDLNHTMHTVVEMIPGVVRAAPPGTRTPIPSQTIKVVIDTKGGGCDLHTGAAAPSSTSWLWWGVLLSVWLRWRQRLG
jgi:hypothetical protein